MAVPAATAAGRGVLGGNSPVNPRNFAHASWTEDVDDAALTGNEGAEADVTRLIAVDEEALLAEEELGELSISPRQELLETAKLLASGGVAGAVSKTTTAPLARLTILYQVKGLPPRANMPRLTPSPAPNLSVLEAMRAVIHQEGIRSLWKGNGVTIIHRLPYSATNFWTYETINEIWKNHAPSEGPFALGDVSRRLFAGGVAGLAACTLAYPLDLIRTRLAAQTTSRYYHGIGHSLSTIVRDEGFSGLYRGLGATLAQVGPCLAINYAAYETARSAWLSKTDLENPTVTMSLACGSFAGLVSSTATFPLDLVRRRMQLQGQGGSAKVYTSYIGAFKYIAANEGAKGLYSGILPEYYKVVPGVAIAFCAYELMKKALDVQTNATDR